MFIRLDNFDIDSVFSKVKFITSVLISNKNRPIKIRDIVNEYLEKFPEHLEDKAYSYEYIQQEKTENELIEIFYKEFYAKREFPGFEYDRFEDTIKLNRVMEIISDEEIKEEEDYYLIGNENIEHYDQHGQFSGNMRGHYSILKPAFIKMILKERNNEPITTREIVLEWIDRCPDDVILKKNMMANKGVILSDKKFISKMCIEFTQVQNNIELCYDGEKPWIRGKSRMYWTLKNHKPWNDTKKHIHIHIHKNPKSKEAAVPIKRSELSEKEREEEAKKIWEEINAMYIIPENNNQHIHKKINIKEQKKSTTVVERSKLSEEERAEEAKKIWAGINAIEYIMPENTKNVIYLEIDDKDDNVKVTVSDENINIKGCKKYNYYYVSDNNEKVVQEGKIKKSEDEINIKKSDNAFKLLLYSEKNRYEKILKLM